MSIDRYWKASSGVQVGRRSELIKSGGNVPREQYPMSQRGNVPSSGDMPREQYPMSQRGNASSRGDMPREQYPVSQRGNLLECSRESAAAA